jgi:AcrR family transcriptional regulator
MTTKVSAKTKSATAGERLLDAATELFYNEGIHNVGIDRVIEKAGVAKASLYNTYGSKEALVRQYLEGRHEARKARIVKHMALHDTPREKLLSVFDALAEAATLPGYRGCAFINANGEGEIGDSVRQFVDDVREWIRALFESLAREAGATHPASLADQLVLLYDGASVSASIDHNKNAAATARAVASALLDNKAPHVR